MESLKIVGLAVLAAIAYGIVHDQVTARVCVEYFTIGHPPLIPSESPTLLALAWGVVATWWVGLPLGGLLAVAARAGTRPKLDARGVAPSIGKLLVVMAATALVAGVLGYALARHGDVALYEVFGKPIPEPARAGFIADLFAHNASYLSGIVGGLVMAVRTRQTRAAVLTPQ